MRVSGIPFAMVTLAFAQAGSVLVRRNQDVTGGEEGLRLPVDQVPSARGRVEHAQPVLGDALRAGGRLPRRALGGPLAARTSRAGGA
jgi:hypothetical protein